MTCIDWREFDKYLEIVRSSYGPGGQIMTIQNSVGGSATSSRHLNNILMKYETKDPVVKLMVAAALNHTSTYHDGSSFMATFLTYVINNVASLDIPLRLCCKVLEWCLCESKKILPCLVQKTFEISVCDITSHIKTVIQSKLLTYLDRYEIEGLVVQLAEIIISMGGILDESCIHILKRSNSGFSSHLHHGIILDRHHGAYLLEPGCYKAAMFECSMSGDIDYLEKNSCYIGSNPDAIAQSILDLLAETAQKLISKKINLIICQRVIHPRLKMIFYQNKVNFLERLGLESMNRIVSMTNVQPIKSVDCDAHCIESVDLQCSHLHQSDGTWLLIDAQRQETRPTYCLIIAHWSEQILSDIEASCWQSLKSVSCMLQEPELLVGGGVWQHQLSETLMAKASSSNDCPPGTTLAYHRLVVQCFVKSLQSCAKQVSGKSHSPGQVYDALHIQYKALTSAVSLAKTILLIGNVRFVL